jgi:hypothetical protein
MAVYAFLKTGLTEFILNSDLVWSVKINGIGSSRQLKPDYRQT